MVGATRGEPNMLVGGRPMFTVLLGGKIDTVKGRYPSRYVSQRGKPLNWSGVSSTISRETEAKIAGRIRLYL